jgi:hypothetical protein
MVDNDAPKAAPGWYPFTDGTQGQRYWNGSSWTGQTRPTPVTAPVPAKASRGLGCGCLAPLVIVFLAAIAISIYVGVKSNELFSRAPVSSPSSTPMIPEGFRDFGDGVAYKFPEGKCVNESLARRCGQVALYAYKNCPSLVYLEGNLMVGADVIYDTVNATVGSMTAGSVAIVELASYKPVSETPTIMITKLSCN